VPQDERKGMARGHTIEGKTDICMTDTAACDLDNKLVGTGIKNWEFAKLQGSVGSVKLESMRALNASHYASLLSPDAISGMCGAWGRASRQAVIAVTALRDKLTWWLVFTDSCVLLKAFRKTLELNRNSGVIHHDSDIQRHCPQIQRELRSLCLNVRSKSGRVQPDRQALIFLTETR
jgi:hypothetical protein